MGWECLLLVMPVLAQGGKAVDRLFQEVLKEQNKSYLVVFMLQYLIYLCYLVCHWDSKFSGVDNACCVCLLSGTLGICIFPTFPEALQCLSDSSYNLGGDYFVPRHRFSVLYFWWFLVVCRENALGSQGSDGVNNIKWVWKSECISFITSRSFEYSYFK